VGLRHLNLSAKMAIHVLDEYYLAITLLITIAYQLIFFSIAFTFKFDKLTGISPLFFTHPYPLSMTIY